MPRQTRRGLRETIAGEVTSIPYAKPQGAREYFVSVGDNRYTVWEFPFKWFRKFANSPLKGLGGMVLMKSKLIILDSDLKKAEKQWTLMHEIAHAYRYENGLNIGNDIWDEMECELLVAAKAEPTDYHFSTQKEVLTALRAYMKGSDNPYAQARRLVEFLREGANVEEAEPRRTPNLPADSLSSG